MCSSDLLQIFHIFGKFCLERAREVKFQISNLTFSKKQDHESIIQKITINKIYHAWTQKSNLMLNLGQIFAKFYLAKFARAGSNLAKINLMRGHSIACSSGTRQPALHIESIKLYYCSVMNESQIVVTSQIHCGRSLQRPIFENSPNGRVFF